ncbi:MAG TPA: hypothetical protein VKT49_20290 [Bryobacteraceae bacterium]|nr:hypothetical protein [Bryobacteraceae bacterium]
MSWERTAAVIVCLFPGVAAAQSLGVEVRSHNGLESAYFRLTQGMIQLDLPSDMSAGDRVEGTIHFFPTGADQKQISRDADQLAEYTLDLPGNARFERSTVASGDSLRVSWTIPANLGPGDKTVRLRDGRRGIVAEGELAIIPTPADRPDDSHPVDLLLPLEATAGGLVSIWGGFPLSTTVTASIGGKPAVLVAQSPRKAVFLSPGDVAGPTTIEVQAGPISARGPFQSIRLALTMNRTLLVRGQSAELNAVVWGLQSLSGREERLQLVLANKAPEIASLSGGAVQRISIGAHDLASDGSFHFKRKVTALKAGRFDIVLVPQLPLAAMAQLIVSRWSRLSNIAVADPARTLIAGGTAQARAVLDEIFGSQAAFDADPGDLVDSLVREYCFDLRNRKLRAAFAFEPPDPGRRVARFAAGFQPPAASARTPVEIDSPAVQSRTFLQFIGGLLGRLSPTNPWGRILVTSTPASQSFQVDRTSGFEYITNQTMNATVGTHTVAVGSCIRQVEVRPNQVSAVDCVVQR